MPDTGRGRNCLLQGQGGVSASLEGASRSLSCAEGGGAGGPHARADLGSRQAPCMPIDLLLSEPLMSAPLCQALCSLLVMKQFPKRTKREKTFISRSVLALTFSRVSVEGQALLEVLDVLLGAEPSLHTHRAHLPVALERDTFGSQESHCGYKEVVAERSHVTCVR